MANSTNWDRRSVNESLHYRASEADIRYRECLSRVKERVAYRAFADEASAKLAVYEYLLNRPFLESREQLLSALRDMTAMEAPNMQAFDHAQFSNFWTATIRGLIIEFDR